MSNLTLNVHKKWFDMILSGDKKEEYREIKPYWEKRFYSNEWIVNTFYFDTIVFINGYSKNAPKIVVKCLGIKKGNAKPEWSDNWQGEVFIISLGEIIETKNIK